MHEKKGKCAIWDISYNPRSTAVQYASEPQRDHRSDVRIARVLPQKKAQSYSAGQPGSIEISVSNAIVCLARFRSHGMCDLSPIPYLGCSVHMPAPQLQSAHSPPSPTPAPAPQRLAIASVAHSAYRDHYESARGKLGYVNSISAFGQPSCLSWVSGHHSSLLGKWPSFIRASESVRLAPCKRLIPAVHRHSWVAILYIKTGACTLQLQAST